MVYKDYLNAARKHKYTCEVIFEKLNGINEQTDKAKYRYLLLNLYYLSGYVIECTVKYGIYNLIGYEKEKDVKELNEKGLMYDLHIKHHKFERYAEHLRRSISRPIPLINTREKIDKYVVQLYREWDADVRYSYDLKGKENHHYTAFYKCAAEIFKIIIDNVRG